MSRIRDLNGVTVAIAAAATMILAGILQCLLPDPSKYLISLLLVLGSMMAGAFVMSTFTLRITRKGIEAIMESLQKYTDEVHQSTLTMLEAGQAPVSSEFMALYWAQGQAEMMAHRMQVRYPDNLAAKWEEALVPDDRKCLEEDRSQFHKPECENLVNAFEMVKKIKGCTGDGLIEFFDRGEGSLIGRATYTYPNEGRPIAYNVEGKRDEHGVILSLKFHQPPRVVEVERRLVIRPADSYSVSFEHEGRGKYLGTLYHEFEKPQKKIKVAEISLQALPKG